jgi:cell division initiation protein
MTDGTPTRLEPVEVQHVQLREGRKGYVREDVDRLLEVVTASYEDVWFERDALQEQVAELRAEAERARERERLLGDVMRSAQKTAEDTLAEARETAERILAKARKRADTLLSDARREPGRLREEIRLLTQLEQALHERFRTFVAVADRVLDEGTGGEKPEPTAPATVASPERPMTATAGHAARR